MKKWMIVLSLLLLAAFAVTPAVAYLETFDDVSDIVGSPDPEWTLLSGVPFSVRAPAFGYWPSHYYGITQQAASVTAVTGLNLADGGIETDIIRMGNPGDGGFHGVTFRVGDANNFGVLVVKSDWVSFNANTGGGWMGEAAAVRFSDNANHVNENAHVVLTVQGNTISALVTALGTGATAQTSLTFGAGILLPSGSVGYWLNRPDDPGWFTGFDNLSVVPEPASLMALSAGLLGMLGFVRRRR